MLVNAVVINCHQSLPQRMAECSIHATRSKPPGNAINPTLRSGLTTFLQVLADILVTSKTDGDAFMAATPKQYASVIVFERLVGFDAQLQNILLLRVRCKTNILVVV